MKKYAQFILLGFLLVACSKETIVLQENPAPQVYAAGSVYSETGVLFPIAAPDTYYNITIFTKAISQGVAVQDNKSLVLYEGPYLFNYAASFRGGATQEYHMAVGVNGLEKENCHSSRVIGTGGDVGNMGSTCILQLAAGDVVTLMVENEGGTGDITIQDLGVTMVLI